VAAGLQVGAVPSLSKVLFSDVSDAYSTPTGS